MSKTQTFTLVSITFLSIVSGLLFWTSWKSAFELTSTFNLIIVGFFTIFLFSWLGIFSFLNERFLISVIFATAVSFTIFLSGFPQFKFNVFLITTAAVLILIYQTQVAKATLLKPSPYATLRGLKLTFTLFALALSILYFPQAKKLSQTFKVSLPPEVFQPIFESLIKNVDTVSLDQSSSLKIAEETFNLQIPQIRQEFVRQGISDEKLIEQQIKKTREEYLQEVEQKLKSSARESMPLDPQELKGLVESQLETFVSRYRSYLPAILSFSLFFTLTFFSSIIFIVSISLTKLYLWLLLNFGLVKIQRVNLEVEKVVFA